MYIRTISKTIKDWLKSTEIVILYGARQVGKTTILKMILNELPDEAILINCELPEVSSVLESKRISAIKRLFGNNRIVALDEAQKITNIGLVLKLIHDELPGYKIIATGSSSFELANQIVEPLTGRNVKIRLFPLSIEEISNETGWLKYTQNMHEYLVTGAYPGIVDLNAELRTRKLSELASDYLFQDILIFNKVKNPSVIRNLLRALALQVGSQVSVNELSVTLGIARITVESYLDLLEKCFVIFPLESFSSNLRNEIKKSKKYFFYDNGILNALIGNYQLVENRSDVGMLWENYCINERMKILSYRGDNAKMYFWRTYDGAEIDLVEAVNGSLNAWEFKWKPKRKKAIPASFSEKYGVETMKVISPENIDELLDES